jgi:hypothetical protein
LAVFVDVLLVLDEFVPHLLFQIPASYAGRMTCGWWRKWMRRPVK